MTDTLWPDISSYQVGITSAFPAQYRAIAIRSNDGTYRDQHFANNLRWCKAACDSGRLDFFFVYLVFETNWQETFATLKDMVGTPHKKMAVMIDVESWGGKIRGDHSVQIMALRNAIVSWLGGNAKRVGWYANGGDHDNLAPHVSMAWFVLANYSGNPATPAHFAHQFTDHYNVPPFGFVDMNSADGKSIEDCMAILGLEEDVPLTDADATLVAKKVWTIDAVPAPAPVDPNNKTWYPSSYLAGIRAQLLAVQGALSALSAKVAAADDSKDVANLSAAVAALSAKVDKLTVGGVDAAALAQALVQHIDVVSK